MTVFGYIILFALYALAGVAIFNLSYDVGLRTWRLALVALFWPIWMCIVVVVVFPAHLVKEVIYRRYSVDAKRFRAMPLWKQKLVQRVYNCARFLSVDG